jgi:plastocyanin
MVPFRTAAVVAVAAGLALPAAAQAKTKTMLMGSPPATTQALGEQTTANAYFPSTLTINAGDSVKFTAAGFHTANLAPRGGPGILPIFAPNGTKVADNADAAGTAFWFNGQDNVGFNPELLAANFGKKLTYTGAKRVESGLPLAPNPKPMTVKFTKAGTYKVLCDIHPGMKGTVKVLRKGAKTPTAKQDKAAVTKQSKDALRIAKPLADAEQPPFTVSLGVAGKGGLEYMGMVPSTLSVPAGTTVKFQMSKGSYEAHTATFGPGTPGQEPQSYLGQISASFEGAPVLDPRGVYPSDVTPQTLNPTLHGNGFWNSGVLDTAKASPMPDSSAVRFDTPGAYTFYCMIHPFMRGTVNVT